MLTIDRLTIGGSSPHRDDAHCYDRRSHGINLKISVLLDEADLKYSPTTQAWRHPQT